MTAVCFVTYAAIFSIVHFTHKVTGILHFDPEQLSTVTVRKSETSCIALLLLFIFVAEMFKINLSERLTNERGIKYDLRS